MLVETYNDWNEVVVEWLAPECLTKAKVATKTKVGEDTWVRNNHYNVR